MVQDNNFKQTETTLKKYFEKENEINLVRAMNSLDEKLEFKLHEKRLKNNKDIGWGLNLKLLGGMSLILLLGAIGIFGYTYVFSDNVNPDEVTISNLDNKKDMDFAGTGDRVENKIGPDNSEKVVKLVNIKPSNREDIPLDTKFEFELSGDLEDLDMDVVQKDLSFIPPIDGEFQKDGTKIIFVPEKLNSESRYELVLNSEIQYDGVRPIVFETVKE